MPLGFQRCHPGGMAENSPAFQRWDRGLGVPSPEGTAENHKFSRPFGTQPSIRPHPALKRRAIFKSPSGTKTRPPCSTYSSNPSGIGLSSPVFGQATGKSPKPADNVPPFDPSNPDPIGIVAGPAIPQATTVKPEGN